MENSNRLFAASNPTRFVLAALLLIASISLGYLSIPSRQKAVGLIPEKRIWDFGSVGQGEELRTTLFLRNDFPTAVRIADVQAGCSCQSTKLEKSELAPGETVGITVTWSVGAQRGPVKNPIWVWYTPPSNYIPAGSEGIDALLRLDLIATIEPDIQLEPSELTFRLNQPEKQRIRASPGRLRDFSVTKVVSTSRSFVPSILEGSEIEVTYNPISDLDLGQGIGLYIENTSRNESTIVVPIRVIP